ncbi:hypothetical protein MMC07_003673 [Pseudocyphellaria aurata]|nr:hypothetical protein [Pseudocyphellaria aurata]
MDRPKISFAVGKRKASGFDEQSSISESIASTSSETESAPLPKKDAVSKSTPSIDDKLPLSSLQGSSRLTPSPVLLSKKPSAGHATPSPPSQQSKTLNAPKSIKISHKMAEPPAKRAKRTDSSAMWERNSARTDTELKLSSTNDASSTRQKREEREKRGDRERLDERERRDERNRYLGRDDRRHRSRSRDRVEKRRERSRSRERERDRDRGNRGKRSRSGDRDGGRHKNGDRGEDRDKRDRRRSTSRERNRSRRDDPPPRRTDRHRSRSPTRSKPSSTRTRSRNRMQPPKPRALSPITTVTAKSPPAKSPPPASPHKKALHQDLPPSTPATSAPPVPKPTANGTSNLPATSNKSSKKNTSSANPPPTTDSAPMDLDSDPEIVLMRQMMGFVTFKSTKNKKVPGNNVYGVRKEKKTEYRQYMNRVGGFNRPLSPSR